MTTRRQRQVADLLHQALSQLIQQRLKDPRLGFVTVTGVEVSADLRVARVYVSLLGESRFESLQVLNNAAGFLRHELGQAVSLRYVPALDFRLDESLEYGMRIDSLLDNLDIKPADPSSDTPPE
jgi:ribosome-binding factor A